MYTIFLFITHKQQFLFLLLHRTYGIMDPGCKKFTEFHTIHFDSELKFHVKRLDISLSFNADVFGYIKD